MSAPSSALSFRRSLLVAAAFSAVLAAFIIAVTNAVAGQESPGGAPVAHPLQVAALTGPDLKVSLRQVGRVGAGTLKPTLRIKVSNVRSWNATSLRVCSNLLSRGAIVTRVWGAAFVKADRHSLCWVVREIPAGSSSSFRVQVDTKGRPTKRRPLRIRQSITSGNSNPALRIVSLKEVR